MIHCQTDPALIGFLPETGRLVCVNASRRGAFRKGALQMTRKPPMTPLVKTVSTGIARAAFHLSNGYSLKKEKNCVIV
jgi:hypothetical protein